MTDLKTGKKVTRRIRELGKQQVPSEIGCVAEHKNGRHHTRRMRCLFQTAGLGLVETNVSKIDIDGTVNLEIYDAKEGFVSAKKNADLDDLKGTKRSHEGFKFTKSHIDSRGIAYKDKAGDKWQIPLNKQNDQYHAKIVFKAPDNSNFWCRVSVGVGGSYVGVGQKIKCDSREIQEITSIL